MSNIAIKRLNKMETIAIEKQQENEVSNFYLDALEFLQVKKLDSDCDDYVHFYYFIRDLVNPHSPYIALEKLGSVVFFIFLKTRGILLPLPDFLNFFNLKYNEFTTDLKKALKLYPDYNIRDKKSIIKKYIATILKSFGVKPRIIAHALTLFNHFYPLIQHKKEEVVAAVICILTSISFDLSSVTMRLISEKAGIRQSTLHTSVIDIIFPYLKIPSSLGLRPSFELMKRKISEKTSLLEVNAKLVEEEIETLWRSGSSIDKIAKKVGSTRLQIITFLEQKFGDYRNYRIRYRITQQEILTACRLRNKGLDYQKIVLKINRPLKVTKMIVENNLINYLEELKIKELTAKKSRSIKFNNKLRHKKYLRAYQREKYAEEKKEREFRVKALNNEKLENKTAQNNKLSLNAKEIEKRFRGMKPKSYPTLLRTLGELGISYGLSKEVVHSHKMGDIAYATCCFSIGKVSYKVIDSSNCIWVTSEGVKGNHVYSLVRNMFDRE